MNRKEYIIKCLAEGRVPDITPETYEEHLLMQAFNVKHQPNSVWYEEEKHILADNAIVTKDFEDILTDFQLEDGDNVTIIYNGVVYEFNNINRNESRDGIWYNNEDEFWTFTLFNPTDSSYFMTFGFYEEIHAHDGKKSIYISDTGEGGIVGDIFSFIVTRGAVKTNCDFFIKVPVEGDPILVQGDYATAKAKIEKGLPVVCYYIDVLEYEGAIETYTGFSYVMLWANDEEENLDVYAGDNWVKIYPDGTVLRD